MRQIFDTNINLVADNKLLYTTLGEVYSREAIIRYLDRLEITVIWVWLGIIGLNESCSLLFEMLPPPLTCIIHSISSM